jgi:hypothetical protein
MHNHNSRTHSLSNMEAAVVLRVVADIRRVAAIPAAVVVADIITNKLYAKNGAAGAILFYIRSIRSGVFGRTSYAQKLTLG